MHETIHLTVGECLTETQEVLVRLPTQVIPSLESVQTRSVECATAGCYLLNYA